MLEKFSQPTDSGNLSLFIEDIYDAIKAVVQVCGGPKVVAATLWPLKPSDQARSQLLDALNRDNPRKLDPEEVVAIFKMGREAGFHNAKHWLDQYLGYSPSDPVEPESELMQMQRQYVEAVKILARLTPLIDEKQKQVRAA